MRENLAPAVWEQVIDLAGQHPINALLQEDPFYEMVGHQAAGAMLVMRC